LPAEPASEKNPETPEGGSRIFSFMTNGGKREKGVLWEIFKNLWYVLNINKSSLGFVVVKFEPITSVPATQQKILISISSFSSKYPINGIGIEFFVFQNKSHFRRG
jgi:hypothetical protein